jgi:hypothetical protein
MSSLYNHSQGAYTFTQLLGYYREKLLSEYGQ